VGRGRLRANATGSPVAGEAARDRLLAVLQPHLPGRVRWRGPGWGARRRAIRAARVASQWELRSRHDARPHGRGRAPHGHRLDFLYEGYVKLAVPAWSRQGAPLPAWSASGYRQGFLSLRVPRARRLAAGWLDGSAGPIALVLVGGALTFGLFTPGRLLGSTRAADAFLPRHDPRHRRADAERPGRVPDVRPPCASGRSGRAPRRCCHPRQRVNAVPHRVARWPPRRSQPPAGRPCGGHLVRRRGRSRLRRCWSPDQPLVRGCG
jgi:hypothetical protein